MFSTSFKYGITIRLFGKKGKNTINKLLNGTTIPYEQVAKDAKEAKDRIIKRREMEKNNGSITK